MHVINRGKLTFSSNSKSYSSYFVQNKSGEINVTLNSLIDIFTILLIFLLKAYSASGFVMPLTPGINMPTSAFVTNPSPTAIISVTDEYIALDRKKVVTVNTIIGKRELLIQGLAGELKDLKERALELGNINPGFKFTSEITIEADREIPFELLQKIMFTCGQSGYGRIYLGSLKKESNI